MPSPSSPRSATFGWVCTNLQFNSKATRVTGMLFCGLDCSSLSLTTFPQGEIKVSIVTQPLLLQIYPLLCGLTNYCFQVKSNPALPFEHGFLCLFSCWQMWLFLWPVAELGSAEVTWHTKLSLFTSGPSSEKCLPISILVHHNPALISHK